MKNIWNIGRTLFYIAAIFIITTPANPLKATDSYLLATGQQTVIDEFSNCRIVTNNTGKTIYIPTKTPAEWSSFYTHTPPSVSAVACAGCTLDGATVAHGGSGTFYLTTRSCYGSCGAISSVRSCYNGTLGGSSSYSKASCPAPTCASCTTASVNWNTGSIICSASASGGAHGTTRNISDNSAPGLGSASFTCADGSWNKASGSCSGASCSLPWGGTLSHGQSITAYQTASVSCGNTCASQNRTCNNGTLSGSYSKQSCSVGACNCALPWGGTISNGQSVTAYHYASVSCGSSCTSQTRSCSNGSLSGSYTKQSCSVGGCASCSLPWGGTINHGQSVTAYQSASVACGGSCTSQSRNCNNGSLSGSYTKQSCSVASCGGSWVCNTDDLTLMLCGAGANGGSCSPIGSSYSTSCDAYAVCMAYGGTGCVPGMYINITCNCN